MEVVELRSMFGKQKYHFINTENTERAELGNALHKQLISVISVLSVVKSRIDTDATD
jgi:hypothetical protein